MNLKTALLSILAVSAFTFAAQAKTTVAACEGLTLPQFNSDDTVTWNTLPNSGVYIYDDKTSLVKVSDKQEARPVQLADDENALNPEGMSELLGILGYKVTKEEIKSITVWRLISPTKPGSFGESMSYSEVNTTDGKILPVVQLGFLIGKCTKK